eukprot:12317367-Alexandrium_andersonii.AAC.1
MGGNGQRKAGQPAAQSAMGARHQVLLATVPVDLQPSDRAGGHQSELSGHGLGGPPRLGGHVAHEGGRRTARGGRHRRDDGV